MEDFNKKIIKEDGNFINEATNSITNMDIDIPGAKRIFSDIIITTISIVVLFILYNLENKFFDKAKDIYDFLAFVIISCIIAFVFFLAAVDIVIAYFLRKKDNRSFEYNFFHGILSEKAILINFIASGILVSIFLKLFFTKNKICIFFMISRNEKLLMKAGQESCKYIFRFIIGVSLCLSVFLIGFILLYLLNFKMYLNYYKKRINKNRTDFEIIEMLNNLLMYNTTNFEIVARDLVQILSTDGKYIRMVDLRDTFGEESSGLIMKSVDPNHDNKLTKEEIEVFYYATYTERDQLIGGLKEKDRTLRKLRVIFTGMKVVIGAMAFFASIGKSEEVKKYVVFVLSVLVGAGYVFSSVIVSIFNSLIFILFIRPFDVGDIIIVDKKVLLVNDIGLISTSFYENSLYVEVPNKNLINAEITNLRKSMCKEETVVLRMGIEELKGNEKVISERLLDITSKNPVIYSEPCKLEQYTILANNMVEVKVRIFFKIRFQEILSLQKRKDNFTIELHAILNELGINCK